MNARQRRREAARQMRRDATDPARLTMTPDGTKVTVAGRLTGLGEKLRANLHARNALRYRAQMRASDADDEDEDEGPGRV